MEEPGDCQPDQHPVGGAHYVNPKFRGIKDDFDFSLQSDEIVIEVIILIKSVYFESDEKEKEYVIL